MSTVWRVREIQNNRNERSGERTMLPARPPAIKANPIKRISRARHTARESPNPTSPRTLSLSIMLIMMYPKREQIPGTQSTKVTWTGGGSFSPQGECAWAERMAASKNVQFAKANWDIRVRTGRSSVRQCQGTHEGPSEIDSDGSFVPSQ